MSTQQTQTNKPQQTKRKPQKQNQGIQKPKHTNYKQNPQNNNKQ